MSCHPHSDTAGSASSPGSHPVQEGQEGRGKAFAGSQEGLNSLYSAMVGGNLSPGRSLDTTWDEAKRKANSSSELIPLQCCLPSHREFPLQPRSHRDTALFLFSQPQSATAQHLFVGARASRQLGLRGSGWTPPQAWRAGAPRLLFLEHTVPRCRRSCAWQGSPSSRGGAGLAGHRRGPRTSGSNCARENPGCLRGADVRAGRRRALYHVRKENPVVVSTSSGCLCSPQLPSTAWDLVVTAQLAAPTPCSAGRGQALHQELP